MRIPNSTTHVRTGTNMTPLVDVVFLLIVFFLVSSHLARQESRLPVRLPTADTYDPVDPEKAPLTVSIDDQARLLVAGNVVDETALGTILADFAAESGGPPAIRIRSDGRVPYQYAEPVLRLAAEAGIADAAIAVREREP